MYIQEYYLHAIHLHKMVALVQNQLYSVEFWIAQLKPRRLELLVINFGVKLSLTKQEIIVNMMQDLIA